MKTWQMFFIQWIWKGKFSEKLKVNSEKWLNVMPIFLSETKKIPSSYSEIFFGNDKKTKVEITYEYTLLLFFCHSRRESQTANATLIFNLIRLHIS